MPKGDRTGPRGKGPETGKAMRGKGQGGRGQGVALQKAREVIMNESLIW